MDGKRVLLVKSGRFIGGVIEHLFANCAQLEVVEAAPSSSQDLLKTVSERSPDVVVLDDTLQASYLVHLLRFMRQSQGLRVVVVSTDSNQVEVYDKAQIDVRKTADFLSIIEGG